MKILKLPLITLFSALCFFSIAFADSLATKDECISKCSDVANIIKTSGAAEAIRQVNDVNGPYVWKDTYVYIMDLGATIVSHGPQPKFIGRNLMGLKDPVTKMPWYPALFEKINSQNLTNGWFDYHWKKTDAEGIFTKHCYFQREGDLVVFAGIYGDKVK